MVLGMSLLASSVAVAEPSSDSGDNLDELTARVEETGQAYNDAVSRQEELQAQIDDLNSQIDDLSAKLERQRKRSDACMVSSYKYSSDGREFVSVLCNARSFSDAVSTVDYYNRLNEYNNDEIMNTLALQQDLEQKKADLENAKAEADQAAADAQAALGEAQAAREEAQQRAEAGTAAVQANSEMNDSANSAASIDSSATPGNISSGDVNWSVDKSAFVAEWAPRIDAYLAGSPTAGLGTAYASAAWDYSVDPRWAPAISAIESSKGANCFRPYNAWGFFNKPPNFTSWEDGINRVERSLGRTYGGYLTYDAAEMYCPSDPGGWYNNVSSEMAKI